MGALVDSSVWIALFLDADTQHAKAARLLPRVTGTIYAPYCIVAEVATVLAYKHSKAQADAFLAYLDGNRDIVLMDDVLQDEISFFRALRQKISFADAAILFLSKKMNARLVTFDRQLERIAKRASV